MFGAELFKHFANVYVQDATHFSLPRILSAVFLRPLNRQAQDAAKTRFQTLEKSIVAQAFKLDKDNPSKFGAMLWTPNMEGALLHLRPAMTPTQTLPVRLSAWLAIDPIRARLGRVLLLLRRLRGGLSSRRLIGRRVPQ